jgi:hypothetical protein
VKGELKDDGNFRCSVCIMGDHRNVGHEKEVVVDDAGSVEWVDSFCCLGDVMSCGRGVKDAVRHRVKCAWGKFRELSLFLTLRGMSLKLKGNCIQLVCRVCWCLVVRLGLEGWGCATYDEYRENDGQVDVWGVPERPKVVAGVTGLHGYCVHM